LFAFLNLDKIGEASTVETGKGIFFPTTGRRWRLPPLRDSVELWLRHKTWDQIKHYFKLLDAREPNYFQTTDSTNYLNHSISISQNINKPHCVVSLLGLATQIVGHRMARATFRLLLCARTFLWVNRQIATTGTTTIPVIHCQDWLDF
jgi:hypothetical protein